MQRFKTADPTRAPTPAEILPPSGAGETGFDSTGAIRKKKKIKKKSGEPHPLPPPPPPCWPAAAAARRSSRCAKSYAEAYKPPDAPVRRIAPVLQDAFEPIGVRVGSFLLKPSIEVTRGYQQQSRARSERQALGLHLVEPALNLQSEWARHEFRAELRGSHSRY